MVYYTAFVTGTISPNKELHLGDKFILEYSENGVWKKMCAGKGEEGRIIDEYAAFDIPFIEVNPNGYSSGDKLKLRITNVSRPYDVDWYFDGGKLTLAQLTLSQGNVTLTSGIHRIKAEVKYSDGTKEILVQEIKVK